MLRASRIIALARALTWKLIVSNLHPFFANLHIASQGCGALHWAAYKGDEPSLQLRAQKVSTPEVLTCGSQLHKLLRSVESMAICLVLWHLLFCTLMLRWHLYCQA